MPPKADQDNVTPLPGTQTLAEKRAAADAKRKEFLARVKGAELKSLELPRSMLKVIPFAVANLMMVDILNGRIKVRTAGEAAQIAKIALEMGRLEMGDAVNAEPLTSDERKQRITEAGMLMQELKKRKDILEAQADDTPGPVLPVRESPDAETG